MSDLCNLTVIQNLPLFDRPVLQVTLTVEGPAKCLKSGSEKRRLKDMEAVKGFEGEDGVGCGISNIGRNF